MTNDPQVDTSTVKNISDAIHENLDKVSQFAQRDEEKRTAVQRAIERISVFFGEPRFLLFCAPAWHGLSATSFCITWAIATLTNRRFPYYKVLLLS